MTEAERACDLPITKPVEETGRSLDECIAMIKDYGSGAILDEDFAQDLQEIIELRKPLDTSAWN